MIRKTNLILSTALFLSPFTFALDTSQVMIKDVIYGGTGCPLGTARAILSGDKQEISVFFDEYEADSSNRNNGFDRKSCNLGIGLSIPPGLTAALFSLDFRGFYSIPAGGKATLNASYFFAGDPIGTKFSKSWGSKDTDTFSNFFEPNEFNSIVYSDCGDDVIARVNSNILAESNDSDQPTQIQVDTVDGSAGYIYHLKWKSC